MKYNHRHAYSFKWNNKNRKLQIWIFSMLAMITSEQCLILKILVLVLSSLDKRNTATSKKKKKKKKNQWDVVIKLWRLCHFYNLRLISLYGLNLQQFKFQVNSSNWASEIVITINILSFCLTATTTS